MKYLIIILFLISCKSSQNTPTTPKEPISKYDTCCYKVMQIHGDSLVFIGYIDKNAWITK